MTEKDAKKLFMPKYPCVDKMCATCPFQPSGKGYARDHEDFPAILQTIELGMPFFCHKTVIEDHRTEVAYDFKAGEPVPDPPVQPHFRHCLGAVKYKRGELTLKTAEPEQQEWTVERVKDELPDVKVKEGKAIKTAQVRGRKLQFAQVRWEENKHVEVAWETIARCLNLDVPITVE